MPPSFCQRCGEGEAEPDPNCPECSGEGWVGEWDRCGPEIPVCTGGALGGKWSCTCDGGLPSRRHAWLDERSGREGRYLFGRMFERIALLENAVRDLLEGGAAGEMAAALVALEALEVQLQKRASEHRRRNTPWHQGYDAGLQEGMRRAIEHARRRFRHLRRPEDDIWDVQHNATTPETARLWEQIELFGGVS